MKYGSLILYSLALNQPYWIFWPHCHSLMKTEADALQAIMLSQALRYLLEVRYHHLAMI